MRTKLFSTTQIVYALAAPPAQLCECGRPLNDDAGDSEELGLCARCLQTAFTTPQATFDEAGELIQLLATLPDAVQAVAADQALDLVRAWHRALASGCIPLGHEARVQRRLVAARRVLARAEECRRAAASRRDLRMMGRQQAAIGKLQVQIETLEALLR